MGQVFSKLSIIGGIGTLGIGVIGTLVSALLSILLSLFPMVGTGMYIVTYIFYSIGLVGLNMIIGGAVTKDNMTNITY